MQHPADLASLHWRPELLSHVALPHVLWTHQLIWGNSDEPVASETCEQDRQKRNCQVFANKEELSSANTKALAE